MKRRTLRSGLMAGVACITLSGTAAVANGGGWSSMVVFGDRWLDSGQFVSHEAVFNDGSGSIGDGRARATGLVEEGGYAEVYSQRVSRALGFGDAYPSQPAQYAGASTPPDGQNYAAMFNYSGDVLASIDGTSYSTGGIRFRSDADTVVTIPGRTEPGFLNDPDKSAWGALVLLNGGMRDLRNLADVDRDLDNTIDFSGSYISDSSSEVDFYSRWAADDIADGADALAEAGAGLIVVPNMVDLSHIPETLGDQGLVTQADTELKAREDEAEAAASRAAASREAANTAYQQSLTAATTATQFTQNAADAAAAVTSAQDALEAIYNFDPTDAVAIAQAETQLAAAQTTAITLANQANTARTVAEQTAAQAVTLDEAADKAEVDAAEVALTAAEIRLRPQIDRALADPTLISRIRGDASEAYNDQLTERLRGVDGNIVLVDQKSLLDAIIADPARFGFNAEFNQATSCYFSSELYPCEAVSASEGELLFSNGLDLSAAGHQAFADQITALVSAPSAVGGLPYVGINAARGISDSARDQVSREQMLHPGIAPFATIIGAGTNLDPQVGNDLHEAHFYSGLAGLRYTLGEGFAIGGGLGYQRMQTPGKDSVFDYGGDAFYGTLFAGMDQGFLFGNVAATYGQLDFGSTSRVSHIGEGRILNKAETDGSVFGISGEIAARMVQYKDVVFGPVANFSHYSSEVDGFTERGWNVTSVTVGDLDGKSTRAGLGAFIEAGQLVEGRGMVFRGKALYGHEFADKTNTVTVTPNAPNSLGSFTTQARGADDAPLEFGAEIVFGSGHFVTTLGYSGMFGDNSVHSFRLGTSMPL